MANFLDPEKPLATCTAESCAGCRVAGDLHCHFSGSDLAKFLLVMLPAFLFGGIGIFRLAGWPVLVGWILFIFAYFLLIEIRAMCSHCPHYAEPGKYLQCWANYGAPRLWKYHPEPMSGLEKSIFLLGMAMVFGFPVIVLALNAAWQLLGLHSAAVAGAFTYLSRKMCSQCINFTCPFNLVPLEVRARFQQLNPITKQS